MQSTKKILSCLPLSEDNAQLLGERLASDMVIDELTKSISRQTDRSVVRAWIRSCIDEPAVFVKNELKRQLEEEWASEVQEDAIVNNGHLLTSFVQRLQCIQSMIRVYLSIEDALSSPKRGCS